MIPQRTYSKWTDKGLGVVQTIKDNCLSGIPEQRKGQQQIDIQFRNFVGTFPLEWHAPWSALVTSASWAVWRLTRAGHHPHPRPHGEDVTWTRRAASPWTRYSAASPPPSPRSTHGPSSTRWVYDNVERTRRSLDRSHRKPFSQGEHSYFVSIWNWDTFSLLFTWLRAKGWPNQCKRAINPSV